MLGFQIAELGFEFPSFGGLFFALGSERCAGDFFVVAEGLVELLNLLVTEMKLCMECWEFL